jgi:serine O-acetyltransferase
VGSNASILGDITIGERSRVGAGSVVLRDIPPDSTVVGVPGHIVYQGGRRALNADPDQVSDPLTDTILALADEVKRLAARTERLDGELHQAMANSLTAEKEESAQYRSAQRADTVTMGEGI